MRIHKLNSKNKIQQLVEEAVAKLTGGTKSVTLTLDQLSKLPTPEEKPKVTIMTEAYFKIKALVNNCSNEITWHGVVSRPEPNHYIIRDILVYPQTISKTTVESDDEHYPAWLDALDDEIFNSIRMQGHSHVNMHVSPSGTDIDFYETIINHISDYYIFMIVNKSGKMWINLYDIKENVVYETADIDVEHAGTIFDEWYEEQYALHITERAPIYGSNNPNSGTYLENYYAGIARNIKTVNSNKNNKKGAKKNGLK